MKRRHFIQASTLATLGAYLYDFLPTGFPLVRVAKSKRKFSSPAVEKLIAGMRTKLRDPELAWLFENCFPNTLDTTVDYTMRDNKPDTFVITGDIHAMWLRDSTAQVMPYLALAKQDPQLKKMLAGVIYRQTKCILIDPYANAFNKEPTGSKDFANDITQMKPELHERKWEIDSLCYPIRLSYNYWKQTKDTTPFDSRWQKAMRLVLDTFREQQRKDGKGPYSFMRSSPRSIDTPPLDGYGFPIRPIGLIASMFRPSDDATVFPFLVPSNFFAVVSLRQLSEMASVILQDKGLSIECTALASEVENALRKYAIVEHPVHGKVYAYEVDGFGNRMYMDDANAPSLLSMPYFGSCGVDDPVYVNTRKMVLSDSNPYFYKGEAGTGIGAPHTPENYIWHIGLVMQALTSVDDQEIKRCVGILKTTHGGTGFMHESFHKDDPKKFTRSWFAWANTLFGELIWKLQREKPQLLDGI